MRNDRTTLKDLSIFTAGSSGGVFDLLDRVTTGAGRDALRQLILAPPQPMRR
jgi:DNA mismatch repair ATPase MutS